MLNERGAPAAVAAPSGRATILIPPLVDSFTTSTHAIAGGAKHATLPIAHAWCEWWPWATSVIVRATTQADPTPGRPVPAVSTHT